jgi:hypothetical protein
LLTSIRSKESKAAHVEKILTAKDAKNRREGRREKREGGRCGLSIHRIAWHAFPVFL